MKTYSLPYGDRSIQVSIDFPFSVDLLLPNQVNPSNSGAVIAKWAVDHPLEGIDPFYNTNSNSKVVITINDKSRPVPNDVLLEPLLKKLKSLGVKNANITLLIASGTHRPMQYSEFSKLISNSTITKYKIIPHNCDDEENLVYVGRTSRGTPIRVNKIFFEADLRIVVGDIELHHFAGFSGGVKSAAIGLCSRETININHSLLLDPMATIGNYLDNPLRQDIEEIGISIKVDLALNGVINEKKEIISAWFGKPRDVFNAGIEQVQKMCQVQIEHRYDIIIASPGGYPKDINLYQAQKAMTHASMFCKRGGKILLIAECREGIGSQSFLDFIEGLQSKTEIKDKFIKSGFSVGPHKALQIALILEKASVFLYSSLPEEIVSKLLLTPISSPDAFIRSEQRKRTNKASIAILPYATACIPSLKGNSIIL